MKPFLVATLSLYILSLLCAIAGISWAGGKTAVVAWARRSGAASRALLTLGLLVHTAALVERIVSTGHAPMASMYETLVFYAWTTALVTAIVAYRYDERATRLVTVSLASLAVIFALFNESPGAPLAPVLRTVWFEVHVISSFAGYALFTLAFAGALLYLLSETRGAASELNKYQDIAGRGVLWGFFLFSASMFSGAVWAYLAWGAYWLWEPKVIWSFIVWFYYAGAMHAYYVKEWRGKGLAVATVGGFVVVVFTYLGVSLLMKSSHSF